ncbi:hypothetical protein P6144_10265 [Sphingomonas sp. HITSZ_GF]|uniref:hypothetical protein n=1 Tax=Sphingomonas sp. HITSZ_GF TaxID=3037247 RepID=UPI00240E5B15|nr:hypothetical protein [Sphingomonas sp. HITSZ_GF]MDG2534031.1 hypothetical protein [Sphingomonas sp. HITSZ_GF]
MAFGTGASSYTVSLTLSVADVRALWSAAADRALAAPGMTLADVLDTIGPREDPSIVDCIAMLTSPAAIAGCALESFEVAEADAGLAPAQIIQLPTQAVLRAAHA